MVSSSRSVLSATSGSVALAVRRAMMVLPRVSVKLMKTRRLRWKSGWKAMLSRPCSGPLLTRLDCGRPAAFYYPALLDPASDSRNFETIGDRPFLYLTRLNLENCRVTRNRDLVRLPVRVSAN